MPLRAVDRGLCERAVPFLWLVRCLRPVLDVIKTIVCTSRRSCVPSRRRSIAAALARLLAFLPFCLGRNVHAHAREFVSRPTKAATISWDQSTLLIGLPA